MSFLCLCENGLKDVRGETLLLPLVKGGGEGFKKIISNSKINTLID
jgi:hypothetical protein